MAKTWVRGVGAALALGAFVGCSEGHGPARPSAGSTETPPGYLGSSPQNRPISTKPALVAATSCADVEQRLEDSAVEAMRAQMEQQKKYALQYGWYGGGGDAGASASPGGSGPSAYTTTNVQVDGVDEPDLMKNDGTRIFTLGQGKLYLARSWPAADLEVTASIAVPGDPISMFLDEQNRLAVFSTDWSQKEIQTHVTFIDVSSMHAPQISAEYVLPGRFRDARRVGPAIRVIVSDGLYAATSALKSVPYPDAGMTDEALAALFDSVMDENEQLLRSRQLSDWIRPGQRKTASGMVSVPVDCSNVMLPDAPTHLGITSVATLNLDVPQTLDQLVIAGQADTVYATAQTLYLAQRHWWWQQEVGQNDATYLHKFDVSSATQTQYLASGAAEGVISDQFALDEHKGDLRVATTRTTVGTTWSVETVNAVQVFRQNGTSLDRIGVTEPLAPGERITSARFFGDKGYVVTFRQVDPLFTIDLSDPTAPKKVGELKIPGFSTYIHPIDANHLLTMGVHVPENGATWNERTLKLTVFDVSDFANPTEKFTHQVGSWLSYSEALWQHKAFNYFPERKLLAVPFVDWEGTSSDYWSTFISDLRVFHVDVNTGFTAKGAVSMRDVYVTNARQYWYPWYQPYVRRSVMSDDYVYAVGDVGIRVAHLTDLKTPVATATFD